jgi:mono/diheme cytochrome c family protein
MSKAIVGLLVVAVALAALSLIDWQAAGAPVAAQAPIPTPTIAPPTPTLAPADYGRSLFLAKGCASCHRHDGLNVARVSVAGDGALVGIIDAPDLTHYQPDPAFVRRWLRNPEAVRPNTIMPDLNLNEDEIEALLAFLQTNPPQE